MPKTACFELEADFLHRPQYPNELFRNFVDHFWCTNTVLQLYTNEKELIEIIVTKVHPKDRQFFFFTQKPSSKEELYALVNTVEGYQRDTARTQVPTERGNYWRAQGAPNYNMRTGNRPYRSNDHFNKPFSGNTPTYTSPPSQGYRNDVVAKQDSSYTNNYYSRPYRTQHNDRSIQRTNNTPFQNI